MRGVYSMSGFSASGCGHSPDLVQHVSVMDEERWLKEGWLIVADDDGRTLINVTSVEDGTPTVMNDGRTTVDEERWLEDGRLTAKNDGERSSTSGEAL
jgi:hypothetical protein